MSKVIVALALGALAVAPATAASHPGRNQLILFEDANYGGKDRIVERPTAALQTDWSVGSIAIHPGARWEVCLMSRFREPCFVLDHNVPDAGMVGIEGQVASARQLPAARARRPRR